LRHVGDPRLLRSPELELGVLVKETEGDIGTAENLATIGLQRPR
jgi:hypothetical protein